MSTFDFEEQLKQENVMFKLSDLDLDDLLKKYGNDREYGEYKDYEVYKNYSLSRESWIDFIEVKYINKDKKEQIFKYFSLVVIKGYLCSFDEIIDSNMLYFETYLEDLLSLVMIKSLKYDYIMLQNNIKNQERIKSESELNEKKEEKNNTVTEENKTPEKLDFKKDEMEEDKIINSEKSDKEKKKEIKTEVREKEDHMIINATTKKEYSIVEDIDEIDNLNYNSIKTIFNSLDLKSVPEENIPNFYKDSIAVLRAKLKAIYLYEANKNASSNYLI